jgi:hypothetical protein
VGGPASAVGPTAATSAAALSRTTPAAATSSAPPGSVGVRATGWSSRVGSLMLPIALLLGLLCGLVGSALRHPAATRAVLHRAGRLRELRWRR